MFINDFTLKISLDGFHVMKLTDDPIFNQKTIDFIPIEEKIKKTNFDLNNQHFMQDDKDFGLFIMTNGAKNRLSRILEAFNCKFPVLLEGPTGTSKTRSVQILSNLMDKKLIRFNLSSETTTEDLLGRLVSDKESWGCFSFQEGPFIDAFANGKWLLLDEINLAPQSILQCMEAALDSHQIFLEIPGRGIIKYKQHFEFRIIATQNPNDGRFIMKRETLATKFLSRFIPVDFPEISKEELYEIAIKQAEYYGYKNDAFINDLIEFHHEWSHRPDVINSSHCFTIREITATIQAIQKHGNPSDAIMTFYGIRYPMKTREVMFNLINEKYRNLLTSESIPFQIPDTFPKCFKSRSLETTLKYIDMAFNGQRHVLLIGKEGSGLTQIARWVAEYYSTSEMNDKKHDFCFICTPETTISDWIGRMIPVPKTDVGTDIIIWKDGPLTKAVKKGMCGVLDSLDFAPAKVSEKLNGLLDPKIMEGDMKFDIPENPKENQIDIDPKFRLIATCNEDNLDSISPALLNRFNIIYMDDQLYQLDDDEKENLITFLFNQELDDSVKSDVPSDIIQNLMENLNIEDFNMSKFARICKATARIMPYCKGLDSLPIISFIKDLLDSDCQDFQIPEILKENLLKEFTSDQSENEEPFYYEDSETLKDLMAKLMACSITGIHVCLVGPTGLGKTSMAVAFSEKTSESQERGTHPYQLFSFNMESQVDDIYGTFSIDKGKPKISKGPLYLSMEKGQIFVADEFNLAEDTTIQSLAVALESSSGFKILIPGLGKSIKFHKKFLFIACQNDIKTAGRKMLPPNISKKLRMFEYPLPTLDDLKTNCKIIAKSELYYGDESVSQYEAEKMAIFIDEINKSKIPFISKWSMRDVRKLFRRISDSLINPKKYIKFSIVHHILFYIMSAIPEEMSKTVFEEVIKIIVSCFSISHEESNKLKDCYFNNPEKATIDGIEYLKKGEIGVRIPDDIIDHRIYQEIELHSLWNTIFKILITNYKEPLLISGNSGFKTFVASLVQPNAPIISLHQDTNIGQLLGSIVLLNSKRSKEFYLEQFCKILHIKSDYQDLLQILNGEKDIPIPTNSGTIDEAEQKLPHKQLISDSNSDSDDSINFGDSDDNNDDDDDDDKKPSSSEKINLDNTQKNDSHLAKFGEYLYSILDKNFEENTIPDTFRRVLERLIDHIKEESDDNNDNYGLSDFTTVFKPGLFTSAVFEQYPLILKDLPNLTPAVFERFNQLNSNNPSITLNEDICNTFTSSNNRNLNHFTDNFRIISLSSTDSVRNLSEAALSRITLISCTGYSDEEREKAIASISMATNKDIKPAKYLKLFSELYSSEFDKKISFSYLTKILQMTHLFNNEKHLNIEDKMYIAIYRIICGSLKEDSIKIKILNMLDKVFEREINKNFKLLINNSYDEKSPFYQKVSGSTNNVFSDISNISIACTEVPNIKTNLAFVKPFIDMIDSIFTGLSIHYPVVLEGISGKGKHTAIQYVADYLGYKVVTFGISSATTAEDLFCKTIPTRKNGKLEFVFTPSQILNLINSKSSDNKTIIVLEEINQASSSLLDSIAPLFDSSKDTILLPNGDIVQKGNYNIIALYDPSSQAAIGSSLPASFRINSIYHVVPQYTIEQINKIALKIFNEEKFTKDHESFMNYFHTMSNFSPKSSIPELYTLNDIRKYKLFTEGPLSEIESSIVENMILLYKYSEKEDIDDAVTLLGIDITELWPKFYHENDQFCASLTTKKIKTLSIDINQDHIQKSRKACQHINSLTLLQRNCLLFLMCSVLSQQAAIISGPTSSGKSYIIRYFAKLLGKKMITIQVNNDTGISTLTGQFAPSASLSSDDIEEITNCFESLCTENDLKNQIEAILTIKDYQTWNPLKLKIIEDKIVSSKHKDKFLKEINILRSKRSFLSHLRQEDSAFIKAMQNGYWVLIDGIEAAPKELFEKIIPLCSHKPVLNLYERGPEYVYSRDAEGEFKIHDDFRLFITYNPNDIEPSRRISSSILNKFVTFVLQPIDITSIMSGIVLHGIMNNDIDEDLNILMSSRLATVHEYAKNYSYMDPKEFAAFNKFTGRSLLFNINIIKFYLGDKSEEINTDLIAQILNKCLLLNYCNSHREPQKFYNNLLKELFKEPKIDLIQAMKKDVDLSNEKYKNILIDLYELQMNKEESHFNLKSFFGKISQFELCDIDQLLFHIIDTLNLMDTPKLINKFGSLSIMIHFLNQLYENSQKKSIKSGELKSKLDDKVLLKNRFTTHSIAQIQFIKYFIENDLLIDYTPICFYSQSSRDTITEIAELLIDVDFSKLLNIIAKVLQTPSIYHDALTLLNCEIIRQSNFSNVLKLLPLFILLQQSQIPFSINHQSFNVSIVGCDYSIDFSISDENFELDDDSRILYQLKEIEIEPSMYLSAVYYLIDCFKDKKEPNFEKNIPTTKTALVNKNNHPLFNLFPNDNNYCRILELLKVALLLDDYVSVNLSSLFGQFETDLIILFNTLWNIVLPKEYKSAINVIGIFIDIEKVSPDVFSIMNNNLEYVKNITTDVKLISDEIIKIIDLLKSIKSSFNQMKNDYKGLEPNSILQNYLEKWISDLENKKTEIQFDKLNETYKKEAAKIREQKDILLKNLYDTRSKSSYENRQILNQFIQYLENIEIIPSTFEFLKQTMSQTKLNVERLINIVKNSETIERIGNIPFPIKEKKSRYHDTIHDKICTIFLDYSETIKHLNNILNDRDSLSSLLELSHKDDIEIDELSQFLCYSSDDDTDNSKKELIIQKVKNFASALTIQQLCSLKEAGSELLENPEKLKYEFEKFINRNEYDEYLECWAGEMSLKYDPKDVIYIPRYTPADIHSLFINCPIDTNPIIKAKSSKPGILLKQTLYKSTKLIESLAQINVSSCKNLMEYLNTVSKIALKVIRDKDVDIDFIEEIKKENNRIENEIFTIILRLYPICKAQDSRMAFKFSVEDNFFLKSDWLKEKALCAKYPSLTYWLINNPECQRKLRFYLIDVKIEDDSIPLFLHILRIFSSMHCITFQSDLQNKTTEQFSNLIIDNLIPKLKDNKSHIMSWLNLLLPKVPIDFYDSEVALIYDFINSISQNMLIMKSTISKKCQEQLFEEIIKQMINSIFDDKIHQYFTNELSDQFSEFITNPHDSILKRIEESYSIERKDAIEQIKSDLEYVSASLIKLRDIKNDLIEAIKIDQGNAIEAKLNEEKSKKLNAHDEKFKEFQSNVSTYKTVYDKLLNNNIDDNDTVVINDIRKMRISQTYFNKNKYNIFDSNKSNQMYIRAIEKTNSYAYINPKFYDAKSESNFDRNNPDIANFIKKNSKSNNPKIVRFIFISLSDELINKINDEFNKEREHIIEVVISQAANKEKFTPKMQFNSFSSYYIVTEKSYPLSIQSIFDYGSSILSEISEMVTNSTFENLQFNITKALSEIDKIKDIKTPSFYELKNLKAEKTSSIILKDINPNLDRLNHYLTKFKKIVREIVEKCREMKKDIDTSLYSDEFTLPSIKLDKRKKADIWPGNFDKIKESNLATPFISLTPANEIACCINPFNPVIGPIIPDLYENKQISIKILSFVPHEIHSQIRVEDDNSIFSTVPMSQAYAPITISFTIPQYKDNISNEISYTGDLQIMSKDIVPYTLTCNFTLQYLPLNILIQSPKFPLIYKNKMFKFCSNKFTPKEEIRVQLIIPHYNSYNFTISKKSFSDNQSEEPFCSIKENNILTIQIPQNPVLIHGLITVNIIPNISVPFEINAEIMNNRMDFKIFDHFKNEFIDDTLAIYIKPKSTVKYYCYIDANFSVKPKDIELKSSKSYSITVKFSEIKVSKNSIIYFAMEIYMTDNLSNDEKSYVSAQVNGIEKRINIEFFKSNIVLKKQKPQSYWSSSYSYSFSDTKIPHCALNYRKKQFENVNDITTTIYSFFEGTNPFILINPYDIIILANPDYEISTYRVNYDSFENGDFFMKSAHFCKISVKHKIEIDKSSSVSNFFPLILGYVEYKSSYRFYNYYEWFPICREYIEGFPLFDLYTNRHENAIKAKENLNVFMKRLCTKLDFKLDKFSFEETCKFILDNIERIPVTNFAPVAAEIAQGELDIKSWKSLPKDIFDKLSILDPPWNLKKDEMIIYWHNVIMKIYSACQERYKELEKYNFYLFLQKDNEWNRILDAQKLIYHSSPISDEKITEKISKIKKLHLSSSKISLEAEIQSKSWIIRQNVEPEPNPVYNINDDIKIFQNHSNAISYDNVETIKDVSHSLEIPDLSSIESIDQMIDAYMKLTNLSQSLPFFIYILNQRKQSLSKVNDCFNYLAQAYFQSTHHKSSFLKHYIKSFTNSFEHLCVRLSQSGLAFNGPKKDFFNKNQLKQNIQDYIEYPDPISPPPSINNWIANRYKKKTREIDTLTNILIENPNIPTNINPILPPNPKPNDKPNIRVKTISNSNAKYKKAYIQTDEDLIGDENVKNTDDKKVVMKLMPTNSTGPLIEIDKLEVVKSGFKGKDMIAGIVSRIKNFKPEGKLPLNVDDFPKKPPPEILNLKYGLDDGSKEVPIKEIIELTDHLSSIFIQNGIDSECSLLNTCAVVLIECSQTLSPENKLSCVMLATSLVKAFNALEMPYSVVVFADYKFQFEIKKFDESHSDDVIQKILDCVMVERFAPRIADACYFAKQTLICPNRTNRAFFIISDGLDPYMHYTDDWKQYILNDNQDIFGFFILKSAYLNDNQYEIVKKMWDKFNQAVNGGNSLTRYYEFTSDAIFTGKAMISISNLLEQLKNASKDAEKHNFQHPIEYRDGINKIAIDHVESYINRYYSNEIDSLYIKDDDMIEQSKGIVFPSFQITSNFLANCKSESDDEKINDINQDIINHQKAANDQWKEVIFSPNKPSQMAPSTKGTKLYIQGLIKFCLTDGQENKIWLEKIAGLKRNYRVSVVIDASNSCFNELMYPHSLQTIITFLRTLATIEIPYFDLIVATSEGPIVLAVNQNTQTCLDPHASDLWLSLFSTFEKHDIKCNLYDAIICAIKLKSTIIAKKSFLFVFTDGLYDANEQASLKNLLISCREFSMSVFGIGIGLYPKRIEKIFQKCIWSTNPTYLITALSKFFGNEAPNSLPQIQLFGPAYPDINKITNVVSKICEKYPGTVIYKKLYKFLDDQTLYKESCPDYQAEASGIGTLTINPSFSDDSTMYKKDAFNGQKILICAYWSKSIAGDAESEWVDPVYLTTRYDANSKCVAEIISYYGIGVNVVLNYKNAINELQTGQYYAVWVICGDSSPRLPDAEATKNNEAYLVEQFVDCVEQFWKAGGSVVWWCDNDPLFFQANIFLERAEFPGDIRKTKLRLVKGSDGMKYMKAGNTSEIKKGVFNNQRELNFVKYIRPSAAHNLVSLYEGQTISRANNKDDIAPFEPFAFDSEGGLVSMYFASKADDKCGDIFIDCGFTKLFNELKFSGNDGTQRYVQNIAAFTAQYEKHLRDLGENGPRIYRPVKFKFTINESLRSGKVTEIMDPSFDIIYMVDATGSMSGYIQAAKNQCINISNELKSKLPKYEFQFGAIFYRDPIDSPSDRHDTFLLTTDISSLRDNIGRVSATGGGDGPEDWVGAYNIALNQINWRKGVRLIIHMADAPAHGTSYCDENSHNEENCKLAPLLRNCASSGIKIVGMPIGGNYSTKSYNQCQIDYNGVSNPQKFYQIQPFNNGSSDLSSYFKDAVVRAAVCAAPKS